MILPVLVCLLLISLLRLDFFESSGGRVPDSFLDSLCTYVIYSFEYNFATGGVSLADSIISFRMRIADTVDPAPSLSWGGGG